jgi:hypothetical protein
VTAAAVSGRFQHADDMITVGSHHYRITYTATTVTLEKVAVTVKGTPHWWLAGYGLGTDDLSDPDHDGMETWREFIAGTDPTDADSVLELNLELNQSSERHELEWSGVSNRRYYVQCSSDLDTFTPIEGPLYAEPSMNTYIIPDSAETRRFYRLSVERE